MIFAPPAILISSRALRSATHQDLPQGASASSTTHPHCRGSPPIARDLDEMPRAGGQLDFRHLPVGPSASGQVMPSLGVPSPRWTSSAHAT
jgi:hypothetical protein